MVAMLLSPVSVVYHRPSQLADEAIHRGGCYGLDMEKFKELKQLGTPNDAVS